MTMEQFNAAKNIVAEKTQIDTILGMLPTNWINLTSDARSAPSGYYFSNGDYRVSIPSGALVEIQRALQNYQTTLEADLTTI